MKHTLSFLLLAVLFYIKPLALADKPNCDCQENTLIINEESCYCDEVAYRIQACQEQLSDCALAPIHSTEFQNCLDEKMPDRDPNSSTIMEICTANEPTSSGTGMDGSRLASDVKISVVGALAGICLALQL
jgi:hypothetical protein